MGWLITKSFTAAKEKKSTIFVNVQNWSRFSPKYFTHVAPSPFSPSFWALAAAGEAWGRKHGWSPPEAPSTASIPQALVLFLFFKKAENRPRPFKPLAFDTEYLKEFYPSYLKMEAILMCFWKK